MLCINFRELYVTINRFKDLMFFLQERTVKILWGGGGGVVCAITVVQSNFTNIVYFMIFHCFYI